MWVKHYTCYILLSSFHVLATQLRKLYYNYRRVTFHSSSMHVIRCLHNTTDDPFESETSIRRCSKEELTESRSRDGEEWWQHISHCA
jgi:hypothetical protein